MVNLNSLMLFQGVAEKPNIWNIVAIIIILIVFFMWMMAMLCLLTDLEMPTCFIITTFMVVIVGLFVFDNEDEIIHTDYRRIVVEINTDSEQFKQTMKNKEDLLQKQMIFKSNTKHNNNIGFLEKDNKLYFTKNDDIYTINENFVSKTKIKIYLETQTQEYYKQMMNNLGLPEQTYQIQDQEATESCENKLDEKHIVDVEKDKENTKTQEPCVVEEIKIDLRNNGYEMWLQEK